MVLLIGNYAADQQQSMQRFGTMMLEGLKAAGIAAELIAPAAVFAGHRSARSAVGKWLAYLDKYVLFPPKLKRRLREPVSLVHICDHSNAVYARHCAAVPIVVTCHDLLAVRAALGEATDTPASPTGKILQRWILRGLQRASAIVCVSRATLDDVVRLLGSNGPTPKVSVATLGLNYPYRKLPEGDAIARLAQVPGFDTTQPFVLHVGSNQKRKNREGVLRIFAKTKDRWNGQLVFAGDPLPAGLHSLGKQLGVGARVVEAVHPDSPLLEALYNCATAFVYPSSFEGFGWPVAEAQACGCPVICADGGPLPEVAGEAGLIHPLANEDGFAADILRLADRAEREQWSERSLRNAERFSSERMIAQYIEVYRSLVPRL